ncbi:MAG: hypothetical protein J6T46_10700 [Victivallales bacterium]|nr:hypothetical protein [Victivallales bacterium]
MRHACRANSAIFTRNTAAAISIIVHAGIHAVAQAERFDVFLSVVVRSAADSIDAAIACGSTADTILRGSAADSIDASFDACSSAADAVFLRATTTAFDSDGSDKNDGNDTWVISAATACTNGCDTVTTLCASTASRVCAAAASASRASG